MAQKNRAQLDALITANLPDNVSKLITPLKHREVEGDLTDSNVNILDDVIETSAGAGSAGKLVKLASDGKFDPSTLPASGSAAWGSIAGDIEDQTDLQDALALLAPLDSPQITGSPFFNLAAGGMGLNVDGNGLANFDEFGLQLLKPLILSPRVIGNGDASEVLVTDNLVDYQRTDQEPLEFPDPGSASSSQYLVVTNSSADPIVLVGSAPTDDWFYDGSRGLVSTLNLRPGENILFQALSNGWRVIGRYLSIAHIPVQMACSDTSTPITSGTKKGYWVAPFDGFITDPFVNVDDAPTGSAAIFDLNKNGTTMLSTRVTIDAGETSSLTAGTQPVISVPDFVRGDVLSWDFDQVGSTDPGIWVLASFTAIQTS